MDWIEKVKELLYTIHAPKNTEDIEMEVLEKIINKLEIPEEEFDNMQDAARYVFDLYNPTPDDDIKRYFIEGFTLGWLLGIFRKKEDINYYMDAMKNIYGDDTKH